MAENKIEFEIDPQVAQGNYSNFVIIAHSPSEVILDFAAALPGMPKAKVASRIVLTPEHAKRLLLSLQENITRYESNIAKIEIHRNAPLADDPIIIGERINPTGKSRLKQALREHDMGYILQEGFSQQDKGAQILDINVGLPEIDEPTIISEVTNLR